MAGKLAILFTTLLVLIAAQNVMAQRDLPKPKDVLPFAAKLFQDPTCGKTCETHDDCSASMLCSACWNFSKTCGQYVGRAAAIGI
ncbi:metallocarboxypeptidase inhibitor-like [Nicotiana tomentosiformis]|uniref:metallocarboxypeptidase inhibitor-like n=1 Tax=Nicotiana tomentosiformis TaxID=4098 RepID=UPI00051BD1F2|nr:metallocarboxypeptidase inhibitor-like [Nicotiana tomentosiformis]